MTSPEPDFETVFSRDIVPGDRVQISSDLPVMVVTEATLLGKRVVLHFQDSPIQLTGLDDNYSVERQLGPEPEPEPVIDILGMLDGTVKERYTAIRMIGERLLGEGKGDQFADTIIALRSPLCADTLAWLIKLGPLEFLEAK